MRAGELIEEAVARLEASRAIDHWQRDRELIEAEDLLAFSMNVDEVATDEVVPPAARRRFRRLIERRFTGEPIPYIKGHAEFRGLKLLARPGVFVPRDSSEFTAEQAVRRLRRRPAPVAVDVATGSGPLALAMAHAAPHADVYGIDLSREAVALARENARRLGLSVSFLQGDLFGPLQDRLRGSVDVITLHPPYVGRREVRDLPVEIKRFEPVHTLSDGSPLGLRLIGRTVAEGTAWLRPGGWLLIEVSPDRSRAVSTIMRRAGLRDVRSTKGGLAVTRVVVGRRALR
jgi:release factor glutamine methyltransferase